MIVNKEYIYTDNLTAVRCLDTKICKCYWNVFENDGDNKPIVVYINEDDIRISNNMPDDEHMTSYKYIDELCSIINTLNRLSNGL